MRQITPAVVWACLFLYSASSSGREIEFFKVTVQVEDENGQALPQSRVMAYSEFWWAQYPINDYFTTDGNGRYTFTLPQGEWTLFAASNNSYNTGYFIVKNIFVDSDVNIPLAPDSTIECKMPDCLRGMNFYIMDSRYSPFVMTAQVAHTDQHSFVFHVTEKLLYNLVVFKAPGADEGYLLVEKNIPAGCTYDVNAESDRLSQLQINTYDGDAPCLYPCQYAINVCLPSVDMGRMISFTAEATRRLFVTPGVVMVSPVMRHYSGGKWYYYRFVEKSYALTTGSVFNLDFGGSLTAILKQYDSCPPYHECHPGGSFWLDMRDSFNNVLIVAWGGDLQGIPVVLKKADETIAQLTIMNPWWPMADTGLNNLNESDPITYEIDFTLGPLGKFHLSGQYLSEDTEYKVVEFATEHFSIYYPEGFQDKSSVLAHSLETTYQVLADYTGKGLSYRIKVMVIPAPFAAWAGADYIGTSLANFILAIEGVPLSGFEAGHLHELGHHFMSNIGPWPGLGGEGYASYFGDLGLIDLYGEGVGGSYAYRGWWNGYLDCLLGRNNCSDKEGYFHFALNYLRQVYGDEYHRQFIQEWGNEPINKTILVHSGFTYDEAKVILYSYLAGENLAWLFRPAIDISENRIEAGIKTLTPSDIIVNGDFSKHADTNEQFRKAFEGWEIGAIKEAGDYPRWVWGPTYPGCSEGLLIDSPPPTEVYFQQSIHLPYVENAELQFSIRRCAPPSLTKVFIITPTDKYLLDTVDTSDLQVWYQDYKTLRYDITSYRGQNITLRFENYTPEWGWSCTLYPIVRLIVKGCCEEADINYDGLVDLLDYARIADNWLEIGREGDISRDNSVDLWDLEILARNWLCQCQK